MNLIKVSTDLEVSVHEFPTGSYAQKNKILYELIGNGCSTYEHVKPERLYTELCIENQPTDVPGQCVSMLVDEEGCLKENALHPIGSYLYGTDRHGYPIKGNVLFVGEKWDRDGIDFCGIEDSVFKILKQHLEKMVFSLKA